MARNSRGIKKETISQPHCFWILGFLMVSHDRQVSITSKRATPAESEQNKLKSNGWKWSHIYLAHNQVGTQQ